MAKPTPGPWTIHLAQTVSVRPRNSDTLLARVFGVYAKAEANARLIALAPEMYAKLGDLRTMLEETVKYLDLPDVNVLIFKQAIKDIETVLLKAEWKEVQHG